MTAGPDFLADAADELVAAARRLQRTRRRNRRAATGAAAAMVLAVGSLVGFAATRSNRADAEHVTIAPDAEGFQLVTIDERAPAAAVIAELGRAAVAVEVEEVRVGPSLVGKVISTSSSGTLTQSGAYLLPAGATITVAVGVQASAGEEYNAPSIPFAEGEPLHCLGQIGGDATALSKRIPSDVTVDWFSGPSDSSPITANDLDGKIVLQASSWRASSVTINVVDGDGPAEPPVC